MGNVGTTEKPMSMFQRGINFVHHFMKYQYFNLVCFPLGDTHAFLAKAQRNLLSNRKLDYRIK